MAEIKLFNILETKEFASLKQVVKDSSLLEEASVNTYNVSCEKIESNVLIRSYPAEIDYLCIVEDSEGKSLVVSFKSAYEMLKEGNNIECKIIEYNNILNEMGDHDYIFNLFNFSKEFTREENISRKLMFLCKASKLVKKNCKDKNGITCDYPRMLVTEFMNDYSYELYNRYNMNTNRICTFLMTQELYKDLEIALEIICTSEALRIGKESFELYNKLPKYNFLSAYLKSSMRVSEIERIFQKCPKKQIHKSKLQEFIKDKKVMIDYKNPDIPIFTIGILE